MTGGLQKGDLIVVMGRPSMGKTSLMLGLGIDASLRGKHVGIITLEMTKEALAYRCISTIAGLEMQEMRNAIYLTEAQMTDWDNADQLFRERMRLRVHWGSGIKASKVVATARWTWLSLTTFNS
jgi:replicative DNA helicase